MAASIPVVSEPIRSLLVTSHTPWPSDDGARMRVRAHVDALRMLGPVEVWCLDNPRGSEPDDEQLLVRYFGPAERASFARWLRVWLSSAVPRQIAQLAPRVLPAIPSECDLIVIEHQTTEAQVRKSVPTGVPVICDLDNLEDFGLAAKLNAEESTRDVRTQVRRRLDRVDVARWRRVQHGIAARSARVIVCSALDVARCGLPNAFASPNGYSLESEPPPIESRAGSTMVFVGQYGYQPNVVGAKWMVEEVMADVRRAAPAAELRLIGRGADGISGLARPGVTVVGAVEHLNVELDAADVCVIPLRSGAGTRLKAIEAMANGLPIVSTTIGVEGLGLTNGVDALIADSPSEFVEACVSVLSDLELRHRLAHAARRRYHETFDWRDIRERLAAEFLLVANHGR